MRWLAKIILFSFAYFAVTLFALIPLSVWAHTVYLKAGDNTGQAYAFYIRGIDGCVAVTAAHLVQNSGTAIELYGIGGEVFAAEIMTVDSAIDLALLRLLPERDSTVSNFNSVCQTSNGTTRRSPIVPTSNLLARQGPRAAWIERVVSPAGGIDREFVPGRFTMKGSQIQISIPDSTYLSQGDSGAPIWAQFQDASSNRTTASLEDSITRQRRPQGDLLGLLSSIDGSNMNLITTDQINKLVANAFTPVDWNDISIKPDNVQVVQRWRGGLPGPGSLAESGFVHRNLNELLGIELDLGSRDFALKSIEFEYSEKIGTNLRDIGELRWWFPAKVLVGSYRPGEEVPDREKRYKEVKCQHGDVSVTSNKTFVLSCELRSPLIVRSVQLTVGRYVDKVRSIKLVAR